jgi:two-component system, NarL family, response regulator DevR
MDTEILIVDDHGLVRDGLRTLLDSQDGLRVVGDARTADEALALARHLLPDVVVLDVHLPDRDGYEICGEIREFSPNSRILMFSGLADGSALVEAAKAGADGFVSKETDNAEIIDAVRRVAEGAAVLGESSAQAMFRHLRRQRPVSKLAALSDREREVLALLAEGLTNREIAARLFISEKTVRNHVSGVLRKLGFRHRTEAALFAAPLRGELGP